MDKDLIDEEVVLPEDPAVVDDDENTAEGEGGVADGEALPEDPANAEDPAEDDGEDDEITALLTKLVLNHDKYCRLSDVPFAFDASYSLFKHLNLIQRSNQLHNNISLDNNIQDVILNSLQNIDSDIDMIDISNEDSKNNSFNFIFIVLIINNN